MVEQGLYLSVPPGSRACPGSRALASGVNLEGFEQSGLGQSFMNRTAWLAVIVVLAGAVAAVYLWWEDAHMQPPPPPPPVITQPVPPPAPAPADDSAANHFPIEQVPAA